MARKPGVRIVNGHWFSEAGGKGRYFGRCDEVSQAMAMSLMFKALAEGEGGDRKGEGGEGQGVGVSASGLDGMEVKSRERGRNFRSIPSDPKRTQKPPHASPLPPLTSSPSPSVKALADMFLAWVLAHRGEKAHAERSRHIGRFCEAHGGLMAIAIRGSHMEEFTARLQSQSYALDYIHKHLVSLNAMFNKGVRKGWLPPGLKPFATVEPLRLPPKALTEEALPSRAEVQALFNAADADAFGQMGDIVRMYYNTGARTHELIRAKVADFQRSTQQIVLGNHKRMHTLKEPVPRAITLNAEAHAIIERRCEGREGQAILFPRPSDGGHYSSSNIAERFQNVRIRACVRHSITIYSFRHLWISEMLMAGIDAMLVARMAGTSVKMIESTYGHFRTQSYQDAQAKLDAVRASV